MALGPLGQGSGWNGTGYASRADAEAAGGHTTVNADGTPNGAATPLAAAPAPTVAPVTTPEPAAPPKSVAPVQPAPVAPVATPAVKPTADTSTPTAAVTATPAPAPAVDTSTASTPAAAVKAPVTVTPFDDLLSAAKDMMNQTEPSPATTIAFNKSISKLTQANAEQQAVLKAKIAADPSLRDQPVGTAILMSAARDAGTSYADMVANLGIEQAKEIQSINQFGFEQAQAITASKLAYQADQRNALLQAGDYDGYARQMESDTGILPDVSELKASSPSTVAAAAQIVDSIKRAEADGDTAKAEKLFAQLQGLQPKTYGSLKLDDLVNASEKFGLQNTQKQAVMTDVRNLFTQGDIAGAVSGLQSLQSEAESEAAGQALAQGIGTDKGMSFDEATRLLRQSGAIAADASITSEADLVGLYDDLNIAKQLDGVKSGASGANSINHAIDTYASMLGVDKLDPVQTANLRAFLLDNNVVKTDANGNVTVDAGSIGMPWDSTNATNKSSHLYTPWPIQVGAGASPIYNGDWTATYDLAGKAEDPNNPTAGNERRPVAGEPDYAYTHTLDTAYEAYTRSAAYTASPMSRQDWFSKVANNPDNWKGGNLTADPSTGMLSTEQGKAPGAAPTPKVVVPTTYDAVEAGKFVTTNFTGKSPEEIGTFLSTPDAVKASIINKAIPDLSNPANIKFSSAAYNDAAGQAGGWIAGPGNQAYHMEKAGGNDYNATLSGVGYGFVVTDPAGKAYFMVTKTTDGGKPIGSVVPLTSVPSVAKGALPAYGDLSYGDRDSKTGSTKVNGSYYRYAGGS